jgi:hypothetical protein
MSETTTVSPREPHAFVPGTGEYLHRCEICDQSATAYVHASETERAAFDQQRAAPKRESISRRRAEIQERDFMIRALAGAPRFILEQLTAGVGRQTSFDYSRAGRRVHVQVSVEGEAS